MINFDGVSFRYGPTSPWVVRNLSFSVGDGELCVVVGPTGSGKSTLLSMMNGLVPHFSGGEFAGSVLVAGQLTTETPPHEFARSVGYVGQDPVTGFVTDRVEDEIAYAMENLGIEPSAMRRRVEDALDLMNLHELRSRPLRTLSGGQQQRVAIAAVLAAAPQILVLDEPTSALDPTAAEEVLHALTRLVHDLGMTVVLAEHRLERVLPFADQIVLIGDDGAVRVGEPAKIMADSPVAPPLVELGRLVGWEPIPVSVREARRRSSELATRLEAFTPGKDAVEANTGPVVARVEGLGYHYGALRALSDVSFDVSAGSITALMGRNGSGKSTLLGAMAGTVSAGSGSIRILDHDPHRISPEERICIVGYVPQEAGDLLYEQTVASECATADSEHNLADGRTAELVAQLALLVNPDQHPRDLSEGQRLSLVLGIVLAPRPAVLLLDEPTRGVDYEAKHALVGILRRLAESGVGIVMATHDVELVALVADRVLVLAQGELIADGPARDVVCHTPAFAPQVAKVLRPLTLLTVDEVKAALCDE